MILSQVTARARLFPSLSVRLQDSSARVNPWNYRADRYGRFVDFLHPVSLSRRPLPEGSTLTTEVAWERQYAMASEASCVYKSLIGSIITLEARYQFGGRVIKQVIFRGTLLSESKSVSENENGVSLIWSDANTLADEPVDMFTGAMNIGHVLAAIDANSAVWPLDYQGRRMVRIDANLFSIPQWTGSNSVSVPVNQAFADLLQRRGKLIPDINYQSDGTYVLTARERGAREFDLVAGRINKAVGTKLYVADMPEARISIDYSRVVTRVIGRGDYCRRADTVALTPAWDSSLNAAFLADPSLGDNDPDYEDVGRLFRFDGNMWPYNAEPHGPGELNDEAILWGRRSLSDNWKRIRINAQFAEGPQTGSRNVFERARNSSLAGGNYRYIRLETAAWADYYDEPKKALREAGTPTTPDRGFMELEFQAMVNTGLLQTDSGYMGTLPIRRRRIHTNREYSKMTSGSFWHDAGDMRTAATPEGQYDHTGALQDECLELLENSQHAKEGSDIILNHTPLWMEFGMCCRRIYDVCGSKVENGLRWYVEGIDYTFNTGRENSWTTRIITDRDISKGLGGLGI